MDRATMKLYKDYCKRTANPKDFWEWYYEGEEED